MADVSVPAHTADPWEDERRVMQNDELQPPAAGAARPDEDSIETAPLRPPEPRVPAVTVPLVDRDRWVDDESYWDTQTFIAISGRHVVPRPKPRSLRPPQRFHPVARWKSYPVLAVVVVAILLSCVGAVQAMRLGAILLRPAPTVVPTATHLAPTATATPAHKK